MIRLGIILAIARAEMRLTRRVFRFWVFSAISTLFACVAFGWFLFIHWSFSFSSASAASANPRFFVANFGSNFIFFFLFGLLFLGFDLRARDRRERMVEVLDTLPYSNLELVLGKYVGILVPAWVMVILIALLLSVAAAMLKSPLELLATIGFVLFMAIPAYTFFLGMVFLLASVVRHRLLVSLLSLAVLVLIWAAGNFWIPLYAFPLIDITGGFAMPFPSDIVPKLIPFTTLLQRLAFLVMGFGLLWLAAASHPRPDDGSRPRLTAIGTLLFVVGAGICLAQVLQVKATIEQKTSWLQAHEAHAGEGVPDMRALTGEVRLRPGREIDMDLELRFASPEDVVLKTAMFTLNPALEVSAVSASSGGSLEYAHDDDGLLVVQLPQALASGAEQTIRLAVSGIPDARFAYLDATVEPWTLKGKNAALLILGYESMIFDPRHVSLPPGLRWLPASGSEFGRGDARERPADFYELDLTVELPEGWLAAGPGRRREVSGAASGKTRFRFSPGAAVYDAALVAGPYESRSIEVEDVLLEMLVHPSHAGVFDTFTDAAGEIEDWLTEKLSEASQVGLDYPYDGLTMVEVPNELRGYGGGWRMDSTLIQPAMVLMRESGFTTARFSHGFRNPDRFKDREGGLPRYKREILEAFFENDMNGGNPFIAAARSFFGYQTAGRGPEGLPLDFVFENLTSRLVTGRRGYFSYRIFDQNFGTDFANAGQQMNNPDRIGETYTDVLIHMLTSRPEVWESVLDMSLVDMDPWKDPERTIDVLALKGGAMAQSMLDDLGREKTGQLLASVRDSTAGGAFARADVVASGQQIGEDLELWLDTWLEQTALPGFLVGGVTVDRIRDTDDGSPRYQTVVTVRNGENVPGLIRLDYRTGEGRKASDRGSTDPVRVPGFAAVEIGLVTSNPPTGLRVSPYLALNRDPFSVPVPGIDEERILDQEPFTASRATDWSPSGDAIVVDDLDPGFRVETGDEGSMLRVAGRGGGEEETLDQGLPISPTFKPSRWSRMARSYAYGKYRHTMAVVRGGKGNLKATFAAELPRAGRWDVEYHFASSSEGRKSRRKPGVWTLTLVDASGSQEIKFDAEDAESGWNLLGTFEIADGQVELMISNDTDGDFVMADAVRWIPVAEDRVAAR